jgi:hypothetical protein
MADIGIVQYRVSPLVRFQVTRYHETEGGRTGGNEQKGIYDNADVAYEVAYALCKEEHARLGFPADDERIQYPRPLIDNNLPGAVGYKSTREAMTIFANADGVAVFGGSLAKKPTAEVNDWANSNLNADNPNAVTLATIGVLKSHGQ